MPTPDTDMEFATWPIFCGLSQALLELSAAWSLFPIHITAFRWSVRAQPLASNTFAHLLEESKWERRPSWWLLSATPFNGALETYAYELSKLTTILATKLWFPGSATFIKDTRETAAEADCLDPENSIYVTPIAAMSYLSCAAVSVLPCRIWAIATIRLFTQQQRPDGSWPVKGYFHVIRGLWNERSWRVIADGYVPHAIALLGTDCFMDIFNGRRDVLMKWIKRRGVKNMTLLQLSHSFSYSLNSWNAYFAGLIFRPFYVVTRCMDLQGTEMGATLGLKQYSSWVHCFRDILATEGIGGFYKGVLAEMVSLVPLFVGCFLLDTLSLKLGMTNFNTTWGY